MSCRCQKNTNAGVLVGSYLSESEQILSVLTVRYVLRKVVSKVLIFQSLSPAENCGMKKSWPQAMSIAAPSSMRLRVLSTSTAAVCKFTNTNELSLNINI